MFMLVPTGFFHKPSHKHESSVSLQEAYAASGSFAVLRPIKNPSMSARKGS
jgi:hypothetical protein